MVTTGRDNVGAVFTFHSLQSVKAALLRHDDRKVDIRFGYLVEELRPYGHRDVLGHLNDLTVVEISTLTAATSESLT